MIRLDCPSGKVRFPAGRFAYQAAQEVSRESSRRAYAYRCPECGGWHLTSRTRRVAKIPADLAQAA